MYIRLHVAFVTTVTTNDATPRSATPNNIMQVFIQTEQYVAKGFMGYIKLGILDLGDCQRIMSTIFLPTHTCKCN